MTSANEASNEGRLATLDASMADRLPPIARPLFEAKTRLGLTFEQIGAHLGRDEVAVAGMFYGQVQASGSDIKKLSELLGQPEEALVSLLAFPDRGRAGPMPPVEPLQYRLYEIVQNYGYAFKAVLNEKFGDGIMSAISFRTHIDKEIDENGNPWAVITLRGKWLPFSRF